SKPLSLLCFFIPSHRLSYIPHTHAHTHTHPTIPRPSPAELLCHPFLADLQNDRKKNGVNFSFLPSPFKQLHRCHDLNFDLPTTTHGPPPQPHTVASEDDHFADRRIREVYYLWSLAGGEVEAELRKTSLIPSTPPICSLPCVVTSGREEHGSGSGLVTHYDRSVLLLSLDQLRKRLEGMSVADYYPLTETSGGTMPGQERHDSSSLPLAIKEKDVEYQFHRMVMFTRLLESYPHSRSLVMAEAVVDVCPLVRAEVWAALLGVKGDIQEEYAAIDKDTEQLTDRQIDVDIPRCHQYDTLLSSRDGHCKFKRILKAWIGSHPALVYWQGLDSLCAPFLALNFNDEALALACLSTFISKYLHNFFLKDNSSIMQEYLAVFSQMIAFHEPALFNHLDSTAFNPELYAIPWFLTMFTHILPLHKIYYLWDTLLLGNCSFPLFVGVSILQHLRDDLLTFDFNECILMFSDMPDIDIQACIHDAVRAYLATPPSTYLRKHDHTYSPPTDVPPEALREPLSLDVLRQESCPHISAHDVIALCGLEYHALGYGGGARESGPTHSLRSPSSPLQRRAEVGRRRGKSGKGGRKGRKGVLVDIRSQEEFRAGHVPGSLSLPHQLAFQPDGSLTPSLPSSSLSSVRTSRVIIVVANKGKSGPEFARQLVRLRFPHVCVLHNGAAVLRSLGLLTALGEDP
ncbi:TBC domain-containing protein kinase-like protein, partial [Geodia barretti]